MSHRTRARKAPPILPLLFAFVVSPAVAHDDGSTHPVAHTALPAEDAPTRTAEEEADRTSGQGEWVFRLHSGLSRLPEGAGKFLRGAHGGFAVDRRGKGDVYFALKGCGIIRMSPDLTRKEIITLDPWLRQGNFHNTTVIYDGDGKPHLALPDNEKQRVYVTTMDGALVSVLSHPRGNPYYDSWRPFVPTDVEQAPQGDIFVVTGYSPGDFVVSADPFQGTWRSLIFGGKGREHGKFGTGHGITWNSRKKTLDISDRPHSRIESFGTDGKYRESVSLPEGSLPCDIDFLEEYAVVGCLKGPGGKTPAPAYILDREGKVISTIRPKADLGLELFTHIHNVTWHTVGEGESRKVYLLCQAWNPGGFAVLERD